MAASMLYNMSTPSLLNGTSDELKSKDADEAEGGTPAEKIILGVMLSIFCIFGTVGNALAFFIYYRKREKGTSTIFILCLAVTDFFTCLVAIPYTLFHELFEYWHFYDFSCRLYVFIQTSNIPLSALIMVAIGVDRYFCICHPFLHVVTVPRAKVIVVVLTILGAAMGIVPALGHSVNYFQPVSTNSSQPVINATSEMPLEAMLSGDFQSVVTPGATYVASSGSSGNGGTSGNGIGAGLQTATSPSVSNGWGSTTNGELFTNGLFLEPVDDFINGQNKDFSYETDMTKQPSSYDGSASTISFLSISALSTTSDTVTSLFGSENENATSFPPKKENVLVHGQHCFLSDVTISIQSLYFYQKFYAGSFLLEFIIIAILYALIYRSILARRAWRAKRKRMSCYTSTNCPETEETQLTNVNGTESVLLKKNPGRISATVRDRQLYANIKTAAMLFVVTVFFVISFLPSWLFGLKLIPFNLVVFYMYFLNNAINPIIYAFMNRTFRDDLFQLLKGCLRH